MTGQAGLIIASVFAIVYLGMLAGRLPRLQLDRTGVALLGAIAMVAVGGIPLDEAARSLDLSTMVLLFALMVVSAQLRLGGFYTRLAQVTVGLRVSPAVLLGLVILLSGVLSAVFTNDIVCLAVAPVLIQAARARGINPVPFLLALACAANVGSAATLIGNPQNILIGQSLGLSFSGYLSDASGAAALGLGIVWGVIAWQFRGRYQSEIFEQPEPGAARTTSEGSGRHRPPEPIEEPRPDNEKDDAFDRAGSSSPPFDRWQSAKGLTVTALLLIGFLFTDLRRDVLALGAAGILLCSRRLHSRSMLGLVDWQLLVLFAGLFVVNHALQTTDLPDQAVRALVSLGCDPGNPVWLFPITVLLSNAVSNVPAVMLLLPLAEHPLAGPVLALASTLAGNLLLIGSIANLIVAEAAESRGIRLDWRTHARTGIPVTILTLAAAAFALVLINP